MGRFEKLFSYGVPLESESYIFAKLMKWTYGIFHLKFSS